MISAKATWGPDKGKLEIKRIINEAISCNDTHQGALEQVATEARGVAELFAALLENLAAKDILTAPDIIEICARYDYDSASAEFVEEVI